MDFQSKAKAIWDALDDMAKKNPDAYKQFIQDQLHGDGAEQMWNQLGMGGAFPGGLGRQTTSSASEKTKDSSDSKPSSSLGQNAPKNSSSSTLLDQTLKQSSLLNPILAQVMMEEDEDTDGSLIELQLGSGDKNCKGKPLIEEL